MFNCIHQCIMYVSLKFHSFLYAVRETMSQSMNKLYFPLFLSLCLLFSYSYYPFLPLSFLCVCIRTRHFGGMPRITSHESQSTSRWNQVWNKWIRNGEGGSAGSLNLAEAKISFVGRRNRKAGHCRSTFLSRFKKYEIIYLRKKVERFDILQRLFESIERNSSFINSCVWYLNTCYITLHIISRYNFCFYNH